MWAAGEQADDFSRSLSYRSLAVSQAKVGDVAGTRKSIALTREALARVPENEDVAGAYADISEAQAETGDIAAAMETASQIKDDYYYKTYAYGSIAEIQGGPAASEAFEWIESVTLYLETSHKDLNGFLESLKGQKPDEVALALARAANDLALTLYILRDKESELQKRHAQADTASAPATH